MENIFKKDKIFDAAMSLAKLVVKHNRPVIFNIDRYLEIVVGVGPKESSPEINAIRKREDPVVLTPRELTQIRAMMQDNAMLNMLRKKFVEAINNAFTLSGINDVAQCTLAEIGLIDTYPSLGKANVYAVFLLPTDENNVFVLDL